MSNACEQVVSSFHLDGSNYTFDYATSQTISLSSPDSKIIPAGSQTLPVAPFYANAAYDGTCPIMISYPPLFGTNAMIVSPQTSGTQVSEIAIAPQAFLAWTAGNSSKVYAGNTYGLMAFSKMIQGRRSVGGSPTYPQFVPYIDWYDDFGNLISTSTGRHRLDIPNFVGNQTSGNSTITHNLTSAQVTTLQAYLTAGYGLIVSGLGIPSNTTVSSINASTIVLSANATASLTGNTFFFHLSLIHI